MLTSEQRAAIDLAFEEWGAYDYPPCDFPEYAFIAGIAWGAADMRERAAKVCDEICDAALTIGRSAAADDCAVAIRALPGEAPQGGDRG